MSNAQRGRLAQLGLSCALLLPGTLAQAVTTVTVTVAVVAPPPCVINGNQPIDVDFKEMVTTRIDGSNYRQPITYRMTCTGQITNAMTMEIQGTKADFGEGLLQTRNPDLAISLTVGNDVTPLSLNTPFKFTYPTLPVMTAVPIKRPGSTPAAGAFTAAATIKVLYQ
ncbi:hypothetical protein QQ39_16285 [Pragia fontium]|nr:hypothetical protein QQ39_16285 [Pragia fontium]